LGLNNEERKSRRSCDKEKEERSGRFGRDRKEDRSAECSSCPAELTKPKGGGIERAVNPLKARAEFFVYPTKLCNSCSDIAGEWTENSEDCVALVGFGAT
jgi:hypothetical protein